MSSSSLGAALILETDAALAARGGEMAYVIAEPCIGAKDTACVEACPVDCIHPGKSDAEFSTAPQLYINAEECICCGACVPVCPVSAIYAEEDLPERWKRFTQINAEYYQTVRKA